MKNFPKNKKAQKGFETLNKLHKNQLSQTLPIKTINELQTLYVNGILQTVINKTESLKTKFPNSFALWNIIGLTQKDLGNINNVIKAFDASS